LFASDCSRSSNVLGFAWGSFGFSVSVILTPRVPSATLLPCLELLYRYSELVANAGQHATIDPIGRYAGGVANLNRLPRLWCHTNELAPLRLAMSHRFTRQLETGRDHLKGSEHKTSRHTENPLEID
jgi:hypothetical protein